VVKKDNGWFGTITTPVGRVEFLISSQGLRVTSHLEVKKEEKTEAPQKEADVEKKEEKKAVTSSYTFYSSSETESRRFKSAVDINSLKAMPVEPTKFALTLEKQKEIVLPIS
jgi:hypothetical protein